MPFNLFGKKKQPVAKPQDTGDILEKQRQQIEGLEKRYEYVEKKISGCDQQAREYVKAGNKRGAMNALKRKKTFGRSAPHY
ncbi:hypothetical protein GEMRC1_002287 [Eukaryota sp. GEM-RC1]